MSDAFNVLTIPILLAMFVAINMGGSGTAPAFSAAYGADVIKRTMVPGLFGVMVLVGALLAGKEVSLTLGNGILEQAFFTPLNTSLILLAIGITLLGSNLIGVPQSTSQSTVMAIAGAAYALGGLNTHTLFYEIIPAWAILPVIAFVVMLLVSRFIVPGMRSQLPTVDYIRLRRHPWLKALLILASLYVAFSIGANNVANAAAPIASLTANEVGVGTGAAYMPIIILSILVVAPCFAIGSSLLGHAVTESTGKGIVSVTPFYATVIAGLVATLLLLASVVKGIPTSLVQLNGGAFIALSVSKHGWAHTFSNPTVRRFFTIWGVAPAFAFFFTYGLVLLTN